MKSFFSIKKNIIKFILKKIFGAYLKHNPQLDDIDLNSGHIKITNLEFNNNITKFFPKNIPLVLNDSKIINLELIIPWNPWRENIKIKIYKIIINLELADSYEFEIVNLEEDPEIYENLSESIYMNKEELPPLGMTIIKSYLESILYNIEFEIEVIEINLISHQKSIKIRFEDNTFKSVNYINPNDKEIWKNINIHHCSLETNRDVIWDSTELKFNLEINNYDWIFKIDGENTFYFNPITISNLLSWIRIFSTYLDILDKKDNQLSMGLSLESVSQYQQFLLEEEIKSQSSTNSKNTNPSDEHYRTILIPTLKIIFLYNPANFDNLLEIVFDSINVNYHSMKGTINSICIKEKLNRTYHSSNILELDILELNFEHIPKLKLKTPDIKCDIDLNIINRIMVFIQTASGYYTNLLRKEIFHPGQSNFINLDIFVGKINIKLDVPDSENKLEKPPRTINSIEILSGNISLQYKEKEITYNVKNGVKIHFLDSNKIFFQAEGVFGQIQLFQVSYQFKQSRSFFSSRYIENIAPGRFYYPGTHKDKNHFWKEIWQKTNIQLTLNFQKSALLLNNNYAKILKLTNDILSWNSINKPTASVYLMANVKFDKLYFFLNQLYHWRLFGIKIKGGINFLAQQKYYTITIEDGTLWDLDKKEILIKKNDPRINLFCEIGIEKRKGDKIIVAINFKDVRWYHYFGKRIWILDHIGFFSNPDKEQETNVSKQQSQLNISLSINKLQIRLITPYLDAEAINNYQLDFKINDIQFGVYDTPKFISFANAQITLIYEPFKVEIGKINCFEYCFDPNNRRINVNQFNIGCCQDSLTSIINLIIAYLDQNKASNIAFGPPELDLSPDDEEEVIKLLQNAFETHSLNNNLPPPKVFEHTSSTCLDHGFQLLGTPRTSPENIDQIDFTIEISKMCFVLFEGLDYQNQRTKSRYLKNKFFTFRFRIGDTIKIIDLRKILLTSHDNSSEQIWLSKLFESPDNIFKWTSKNRTESEFTDEVDVKFIVQPLKIHLSQDIINFMTSKSKFINANLKKLTGKPNPIYINLLKFSNIILQINYTGNLFDFSWGGDKFLLNFLRLKLLNLEFEEIEFRGILGYETGFRHFGDYIVSEIKKNNKMRLVKSLTPIKSIIRLGNGILNLVIIPSKQYKRQGLTTGLKNGYDNFKKTTLDEVGNLIGVADDIVENTIEIFDPVEAENNYEITRPDLANTYKYMFNGLNNMVEGAIYIPYREYNKKGITKAINTFIRNSPGIIIEPVKGVSKCLKTIRDRT